MDDNNINRLDDLWKLLEAEFSPTPGSRTQQRFYEVLYDDVAKDIVNAPSEIVENLYGDRFRKERRRIRRKLGRQQRAMQKYPPSDDIPF